MQLEEKMNFDKAKTNIKCKHTIVGGIEDTFSNKFNY